MPMREETAVRTHGKELMYAHHIETIEKAIEKLKSNEKILAVILGGSVAHGFASKNSDIDLMLVMSESNYQQALKNGALHYTDDESADYPDGYVEGKYISESFIRTVIEKGSEPARFAFKDAIILYSSLENLDCLIAAAATYPKEGKVDKMVKFYAQFEGWNWMYYEGVKRKDLYVINQSVTNICLFAGRLLLAYNELLYPYHKWFLKVLSGAGEKPVDIVEKIKLSLQTKSESNIKDLYNTIKNFYDWPQSPYGWPVQYVKDSEMNWVDGPAPIADV